MASIFRGQHKPNTWASQLLGTSIGINYFNQLKKKLNRGIGLLAKIRHFTPKQLLKTLYFLLFNSDLIYGCQIWGQDQNEEFKKMEKLREKAIRIINFLPLNAPVEKQMYEINIQKEKDFIMLQNILFVNTALVKTTQVVLIENFTPLSYH